MRSKILFVRLTLFWRGRLGLALLAFTAGLPLPLSAQSLSNSFYSPASANLPGPSAPPPSGGGMNANTAASTVLKSPGELTSAPLQQDIGADKGSRRSAAPNAPASPIEFQKFVVEASGKTLPLFGYSLFSGDRFTASQVLPVPADYVIGPGDEIQLHLWGGVDGDLRLTVDRNGQINLPKAGSVNVAGVRASQLEEVLRTQMGRLFKNFQLSAALGPLRSIQIFVVGQARGPGTYLVSGASTLVSALFETGGPSPTGTLRGIQLRRDGKLVGTVDLYRFIGSGDKSADTKLLPGDVIVIPPAGPRVAVLGAIDNPAIFELKGPQETIGDLLSYAGGISALTNPQKVMIEHIDPAARRTQRSVEERALDAAGLKSAVRDGDVLTLFKISPQFANAVTLRGNVAAPLRYPFRAGMKISDLIPEREALIRSDYYQSKNMMVQYERSTRVSGERAVADVRNLLEEVNWDYAVIERLDTKAVKSQLIPFNLGRAVIDRAPGDDLTLLPGDVVTIFSVNDVPVPVEKRTQFVKLGGEVKVPGMYQIQPGETLPQLVARAGGFTANSFVYGTEFVRESTRKQQQANLEIAARQYEVQMAENNATTIQNISEERLASLPALQATQRGFLERLKTFKASGRIALDLDPVKSVLPDIGLEDGDSVIVPYPPSFVGVFGAVFSDRALIYREGAKAVDYVKRVGTTRFADVEGLMIVRADGTIESDSERSNSIFNFGSSMLNRPVYIGDSIFVPDKLDRETAYTKFIRGAKDWTSIFYQFGLGAAGLKILKQ